MQLGDKFAGRFELHQVLGEGGVARVYRATDAETDRVVALKCLLPKYATESRIRRRFMREARAVSRLRHPNIVQMFDYGESPSGIPFISMELIDGSTLSSMLEDIITTEQVADLITQVLSALSLSHSRGIVHRDVKPQNVVVTRRGDKLHAKLLDFGFARLEDEESDQTKGNAFGTPLYMSPEQVSNDRPVGPASDLYSVGIMLYELLAGDPPFTAAHGMAVALMHLTDPVPAVRFRSGLNESPGLAAIVMRALKKDPLERYPDAAAMRRAIQEALPSLVGEQDETLSGGVAETVALSMAASKEGGTLGFLDTLGDEDEFQALRPAPVLSTSELLVGRDAEREWLWDGVRSVARGDGPRMMCMGAQHGMGRRRLIAWIRTRVREDGRMQVLTLGRRRHANEDFGGLRSLLRGLIAMETGGLDDIEKALRRAVDRWSASYPSRASLPSLSDSDLRLAAKFLMRSSTVSLDPLAERPEVDDILARLVVLSSLERPALLTVGGLERTGPGIVRFLLQLADWAGRLKAPLLLLVSFIDDPENTVIDEAVSALERQNLVPCERRDLAPFEGEAMRALLRQLAPLERTVEEAIAIRTDGNPFYATELVQLLYQLEELEEHGGRLHLAQSADPSSWPDSLAETIRRRSLSTLESLPDGAFSRDILSGCAILGEAFEYDVLHDFLEEALGDSPRIERSIEGLVEANLLQEPPAGRGDRLHFVHPVVRSEMLALMDKDDRLAAFHRAAVITLKVKFAGHEAEVAARLAGHLHASGQLTEAARYLMMAAQRSRHDGKWMTAKEQLEAAERALHADNSTGTDRARAEVWLELASVEIRNKNFERAQSLAARVYRWAAEHDKPLSGRALMILGDCLRRLTRLTDASRAYEKAVEIFRAIDDPHAVARGTLGQVLVAKESGEYERALMVSSSAATVLEQRQDLRGLQQLTRCLGECQMALGDLPAAARYFREAIQHAEQCGDLSGWGSLVVLLAQALRRAGDADQARPLVLEVLAAEARGISPKCIFQAYQWLGEHATAQADHEAAFRYWQQAFGSGYTARDQRYLRALFDGGVAAVRAGHLAEARPHLSAFLGATEDPDDIPGLVARLLSARIAIESGEVDLALIGISSLADSGSLQAVLDDDVAWALTGVGRGLVNHGHLNRGRLFLQRARSQFLALGYEERAAAIDVELSSLT